jgi:hypothetical protein
MFLLSAKQKKYCSDSFLEFFPPGWNFVVTSVLIRVIHAAGNALVITATFTYAAMEFQQAVGQIFVIILYPLSQLFLILLLKSLNPFNSSFPTLVAIVFHRYTFIIMPLHFVHSYSLSNSTGKLVP